jgi:hypothetical protein
VDWEFGEGGTSHFLQVTEDQQQCAAKSGAAQSRTGKQ